MGIHLYRQREFIFINLLCSNELAFRQCHPSLTQNPLCIGADAARAAQAADVEVASAALTGRRAGELGGQRVKPDTVDVNDARRTGTFDADRQ